MMNFSAVAEVIHELSCVASTTGKQGILRSNASLEGLKDVLKHIYNPYVTTGIKQAKLYELLAAATAEPIPTEEILEYYVVSRTGTLNEVAKAAAYIAQFEDPIEQWLAEGLITKDLQCGVSTTTLNNVFGAGFIPVIGIMRGKLAPDSFQGVYIVTEKIDGNRRLFFNTTDCVETYTRSGHRDFGLKELECEIAAVLPKGYMYDCECTKCGEFEDNIALRQASTSALTSQSRDKRNIRAQIFDMVPISQYNRGESQHNAIHRKALLAALFSDATGLQILYATGLLNGTSSEISTAQQEYAQAIAGKHLHIEALPILGIVHNRKEALALTRPIWDNLGEGTMLVDALSTYTVSITPKKAWLKMKATTEFVGKVIDVYSSTSGAFAGLMAGVTIAFLGPDKKINQCNVGSGFTVEQRKYYIDNPDALIGKIIEGDCFGFSQAAGSTAYSLNCPIFKRIYGLDE